MLNQYETNKIQFSQWFTKWIMLIIRYCFAFGFTRDFNYSIVYVMIVVKLNDMIGNDAPVSRYKWVPRVLLAPIIYHLRFLSWIHIYRQNESLYALTLMEKLPWFVRPIPFLRLIYIRHRDFNSALYAI